jgi:hypothetical protein
VLLPRVLPRNRTLGVRRARSVAKPTRSALPVSAAGSRERRVAKRSASALWRTRIPTASTRVDAAGATAGLSICFAVSVRLRNSRRGRWVQWDRARVPVLTTRVVRLISPASTASAGCRRAVGKRQSREINERRDLDRTSVNGPEEHGIPSVPSKFVTEVIWHPLRCASKMVGLFNGAP